MTSPIALGPLAAALPPRSNPAPARAPLPTIDAPRASATIPARVPLFAQLFLNARTTLGLLVPAVQVWSKPGTARAPLSTIGGPRTRATILALLPVVGPSLICVGITNQAVLR